MGCSAVAVLAAAAVATSINSIVSSPEQSTGHDIPVPPELMDTTPSTDTGAADEKARQRQRQLAAAGVGRGDTILTSPLGVTGTGLQPSKQLLGL